MWHDQQRIERIIELSQRIKNAEPISSSDSYKQAAIIQAEAQNMVVGLIHNGVRLKVIFSCLLYFWLKTEALLQNISEDQFNKWPTRIDQIAIKIIRTISATVNNLPDVKQTQDLKELGEHVELMKSMLPDEEEIYVSEKEFAKQVKKTNINIFIVMSAWLQKSYHPEIISNVIFCYLIRVSTLNTHVDEKNHQKMEYYFSEIIAAIRKLVPKFFKVDNGNS